MINNNWYQQNSIPYNGHNHVMRAPKHGHSGGHHGGGHGYGGFEGGLPFLGALAGGLLVGSLFNTPNYYPYNPYSNYSPYPPYPPTGYPPYQEYPYPPYYYY
ncbi:hypothetical protein GCM10008025_32310 [Ornithinibacillus halotolerans]|uniref:Uncharacterized protein n=2 Tax=Ornithinibacillus halotolerans TaxID=1274357 RepID=A0A916S6R0_9BACI|nr:hypothetical protein GCM10008025_32310 [Ornithinibacillus halotolerans]